jgi:hypothetical protein
MYFASTGYTYRFNNLREVRVGVFAYAMQNSRTVYNYVRLPYLAEGYQRHGKIIKTG